MGVFQLSAREMAPATQNSNISSRVTSTLVHCFSDLFVANKGSTSERVLDAPHVEDRTTPFQHECESGSDCTSVHKRLSFFQRYFTEATPPINQPEKTASDTTDAGTERRFSILSPGSIVVLAAMLLLTFVIIAAAAAAAVIKHDRRVGERAVKLSILANFPDPSLWYANGTWYAYATNNAAGILDQSKPGVNASEYVEDFGVANFQLATSTDFHNWSLVPAASQPLPTLGDWVYRPNDTGTARPGLRAQTWAPAVIQRDDGKYIMYYSAIADQKVPDKPHHARPHCIGAAISDSPTGPFQPESEPLACPVDQGGAIDPEAFKDGDGTIYMVYKIDGNSMGRGGVCGNTVKPIASTPIMLQRMEVDGVTKNGTAVQILDRTAADGPLVEAPMLIKSTAGVYFLFFSSGCTRTPSYDVKYATASNITGPYVRARHPLLRSGERGLTAPGSVGIEGDGAGGWNMAFHARVMDGHIGGVRAMYTTKLVLSKHSASIEAWKP